MEATWGWVSLAIVGLGLVTVIVIVGQWASVRRAEVSARLRQELLARGLSVAEVEQLTADSELRKAQVAAEAQMRQAQVAADLTRDLVARGLSAAEVELLVRPKVPLPIKVGSRIDALASAVTSMQDQDGELNVAAVAGLLSAAGCDDADGLASALGAMSRAGNLERNGVASLLSVISAKEGAESDRATPAEEMAVGAIVPGHRHGPGSRNPIQPGQLPSGRAEIVTAERSGADWLVTLRVIDGVVRHGESARLLRAVAAGLRLSERDFVQADTGESRRQAVAGETCATSVEGGAEMGVGDVLEVFSPEGGERLSAVVAGASTDQLG